MTDDDVPSVTRLDGQPLVKGPRLVGALDTCTTFTTMKDESDRDSDLQIHPTGHPKPRTPLLTRFTALLTTGELIILSVGVIMFAVAVVLAVVYGIGYWLASMGVPDEVALPLAMFLLLAVFYTVTLTRRYLAK